MTVKILDRGNTVNFTFTFYDVNNNVATCQSASVQLTYMGESDYVTELVTLQASGSNWVGSWESTNCRVGWVKYLAKGLSSGTKLASKGRFRVDTDRASLDMDALPTSSTPSTAEENLGVNGSAGLGSDYGFRW